MNPYLKVHGYLQVGLYVGQLKVKLVKTFFTALITLLIATQEPSSTGPPTLDTNWTQKLRSRTLKPF